MRVHFYTIFWNEMARLEFFFRHYEPWVERFVCFDDGSSDGSREYLQSKRKVEVRPFPYADPNSFVYSKKLLDDHCWKESRGIADWVIVLDVDEFLYHPNMETYLRSCRQRKVTCIPALGFDMITDTLPGAHETLACDRTQGVPNQWYCKLGMFDPNAIDSIDFGVGSHSATMKGRVVLPKRDELLLLHYKKLGLDFYVARAAALKARRRSRDLAEGWGHHYGPSPEHLEQRFAEQRRRLVNVLDPTVWRNYPEPRWWRQPPDLSHLSGWERFWQRQKNSIRKRLDRFS